MANALTVPPAETPVLPRILIVDDETAQLRALCDTLRDQGYLTTGFGSASAALATLREQRFDLVLSDLMMPEMDGITLLREALAIDPELIGMIMTGEGTIATAVEAMKAGAFDFILKPFKLSVILPVLSRALAVKNLRLKNAELEKRVHERTTELEAANKELEAFCFSVSHDLRSPLRHIDGFANLLATAHAGELSEEGRDFVNHITAGAKRMGQLIDDLLRLSRLGRQHLSKAPMSIANLAREVLADLAREQPDRQVEIVIGEVPDTVGDWSLLKQVFINLLSNAYKFTRRTEHARIEVGSLEQAGERVYFIRDNGAGFEMQRATKLFGVFQRLHAADQFEGTGVGLSIVQRVINRHGGRVWAEAELDKGATFYFTLPA